jgi:hypothetical protein
MDHLALDHLPPLPADRTVGIGCIGAGFIMADCHLVAYRAAGLNPVAIAARRPDAAAAVAARHSIPRAYADFRRLLDDPAVEVVDIAVPPDVQPCAHTTTTLAAPDSLGRWTFSIGNGGTTWGAEWIEGSWRRGAGGLPGRRQAG